MAKLRSNLTDSVYWDEFWKSKPKALEYRGEKVYFKDIFARYIRPEMSCFEIGCFPGTYLIYLKKRYDCEVAGIDFTDEFEKMIALFERQSIPVNSIYHADFLEFKSDRQYDFVYSLGFIEHFANFEEVIFRHTLLLRKGGILFLETPNYRGLLQRMLHLIFDRQDMHNHYLPAMNYRKWEFVLAKNNMKPLEQRYYHTFDFWTGKQQQHRSYTKKLVRGIAKAGKWADDHVHYPNSWTSPSLIGIYQKQ